MPTRKPLMELVPDIIHEFEKQREHLQFDLRLYRINEGQIRPEIVSSLRDEMVSASAFNRAIQRIPAINIVKKVTDKLSKVYNEPALRSVQNKQDQSLLADMSQMLYLDNKLIIANKILNLHKRAALEIYLDGEKQAIRVLAGHQFFVFSDDPINPMRPTVFVKLMGQENKKIRRTVDKNGKRVDPYEDIINVDILALYSDDEFMVIDTAGQVREDKMRELGATSMQNKFGVIPFIYLNKSEFELMPYPNKQALDISILIPKLLTDLNYSAQFQSHSVIWTKNTDLAGAEINPDAIVNLGDSTEGQGDPEIGIITPKTDIDGVLKLIEFQLSSYLTTEGIKAGGIGNMQANQEASGVSKIIDESDATDARKSQMEIFRKVEKELWNKLQIMQDVWSRSGSVMEKRTFSTGFIQSLSVKFAEIRPLESDKQKFEKIKIGRELKLLTRRHALKELFPNLSEEQIDARLDAIKEELSDEKEEMVNLGLTPGLTNFQGGNAPTNPDAQEEDGE